MRIAYHNPWLLSAENQSFMSLAIAARKLGAIAHACASHEDIEACDPDFVLSVSSSVPKMVDITSYLTVHAPPGFFLETPGHLHNLLSYDGYVTISDSIRRFLADVCFGLGREEQPGFYYNCPQATDLTTNWSALPAQEPKVVYLGTNWDRRMPELFRALDNAHILRIHGPEAPWKPEGYQAYAGPLPFDGLAPQRAYAQFGMGLALLGDRWWREDVISNRIFEITSVGAVAICPDIPWTRKWFGDSVLYFSAGETPSEIARQIRRHYDFCCANPDDARRMGEAARRVFETHFVAEKMLANLFEYHERKKTAQARRRAAVAQHPEIAVVVRCGGRPLAVVKRAVDSIRRQHLGRFTVILVKYAEINLSPLTSDLSGAITEFVEILLPGGGRAATLFKGIERVATPYFAVLDDDDFWLSEHIEELFRTGRQVRDKFDMAFSGSVAFDFPIFYRENQFCSRNILLFGFTTPPGDVIGAESAIGTNCFVARRDLLPEGALEAPDFDTAEDSLLIALLSRRSKPIFSYRATAFYRRAAPDGAQWASHPNRARDEVSLALRVGLSWASEWLPHASFDVPQRMWASRGLPALPAVKVEDRVQAPAAPRPEPESAACRATERADPTEPSQQILEASAARIRELEMQVEALLNSSSWQITAPLRAIATMLRRARPNRRRRDREAGRFDLSKESP